MTQTVNIACTLPHGVRLNVIERTSDRPPRDRGFFELKGPVKEHGEFKPGRTPERQHVTPVDKELWDLWLAENKESTLVTSGSVFAVPEAA